VQELNGIRAIDIVEGAPRQVVMVSKSFQSPVYEMDAIITALAEYTQEAVKRMRAEGLSCKYVSVYLMTNAFAQGEQYFNQATAELPYLSAYLPDIQATANELLKRVFRPNYKYRKVMIGLTGLGVDRNTQLELFDTERSQAPFGGRLRGKELEPLMGAFDKINERYGRGTIKLASGIKRKEESEKKNNGEDSSQAWEMKRDYLSPRYTTNIREIPIAL
jgi:DNA polymerase V